MTTISQKQIISTRPWMPSHLVKHYYQLIINGEDGNYEEHEIEATSFEEAEALAQSYANESSLDITFVELYCIA